MGQKPDRVRRPCRKNPYYNDCTVYQSASTATIVTCIWRRPCAQLEGALLINWDSAHPFLAVEATERENRPEVVCIIRWAR